MNINKKLVFISAVMILFLILISTTASASITETQLISSNSVASLDMDGNKLVWQGNNEFYNGNIYLYDLSTKKNTLLPLNEDSYNLAISGNKVVYQIGDYDYHYIGQIYCYDLTTKKYIYVDTSSSFSSLDISGNIIAWIGDTGDVCYYDINSKKESKIAADSSNVSVYGTKLVYDNGDQSNVFMYDISTKTKTQITKSGTASNPSMYGTKIVYQDSRKGNYDIYMYDISTKRETQITSNTEDQVNPKIYGNTIIWEDYRGVIRQIYAYDLITRQQIHTLRTTDHSNSVISGNKIAWIDSDIYNRYEPGIFTGTISFLPVAAFSASPTTGKHPLTVKFTDKSTDVYYWSWNFGDKTTSTAQNPTHKYTKAGKYTVKLTVKNAAGSNTKTMTITVK
jgi:beta propeller repeat protein